MSFTCSVVKRNVKRKRKCLGYLKVTESMFPCTKYIALRFLDKNAFNVEKDFF